LLAAVFAWEAVVRIYDIQPVILPSPSLIVATLIKDWRTLLGSLEVTLSITFEALAAATIGGFLLALVFAQSRVIERAFFPFAVIMQVTPIISIAPLLLVYLTSGEPVLVCAFLVAFFPILANTALGLSSVDHNLVDLFQLYRASRWRQLLWLRIPASLPYFLGGLRIGGGLALIGAIVAEIAAGSAGQGAGLAFRIVESGYRLNIPRMFAALLLISVTGIAIFVTLSAFSHLLLHRWHDSARTRET
jgi:NitT/TauT family transport system permease protein